MTRTELHSTQGVTPEVVKALAAYLRARMPRRKVTDATLIVNHEGWINGYLDAVDAIAESVNPEPKITDTPKGQIYSAPTNPNSNQNRP